MKRKLLLMVVILGLILTMSVQPALAYELFTGNSQTTAYGVESDIFTPSSAPYLGYPDGESSWVQIKEPGGHWISTGWEYFTGTSNALPFTEVNIGFWHNDPHGTQTWGSSKNYKMMKSGGYWLLYIDNNLYIMVHDGALDPPKTVYAASEIHSSTTTVLHTYFLYVKWMDSNGTWNNFSQNNFFNSSPYSVSGSYCNYITSGP